MHKNSLFITLEGPDGAGKTTQIQRLEEHLKQAGINVLVSREPGGTSIGNELRSVVLGSGGANMSPLTEMLLIAAARAQHVQEVLLPALSAGRLVLCDRYIDSSLVYQGHGLGLGVDLVRQVNEVAIQGLWPDLTLLLMLPPDVAFQRSLRPGAPLDRIESRGLDYYRKVCTGYLMLADAFPSRVRIVDGTLPVEAITKELVSIIESRLKGELA